MCGRIYQGFCVIVACGSVKTYGVLALYVDNIFYHVYIYIICFYVILVLD